MRKSLPFLTVAVWALLASACDAGSSSSDEAAAGAAASGSGGAGAQAGSAGAHPGGAPAGGAHAGGASGGGSAGAHTAGAGGVTGSAGGGGLILGMGGPFPFPQSKKPSSCSLTTTADASGAVQKIYNSWKGAMVTSNGAGAGLRVQRNTDGSDTVSEGIGYGMIAAVYMNDRPTFDGLWTYAQAHFDANGLMNWHIDAGGTVSGNGMGSATDADEDMAWALLMASNQWSSAAYLAAAKSMITAIATNCIGVDNTLKPGDSWGDVDVPVYPDYFAPSYYRVFAKVTSNPNWSGAIIDRNYTVLSMVSGSNGLVPDKTKSNLSADGNYSYDACRTPWRIGMDYCFNAEPRAKAYIDKVGAFFDKIGANNIVDGYQTSGSGSGNAHNMAFIGPAGVAGMVGYPTLLDGAFKFGAGGSDTSYYGESLSVLTMLMMSGNFVEFTKP
ncbi:MAG: glycosyl hydrolase family 8 [Pseudomonadota bacterium]